MLGHIAARVIADVMCRPQIIGSSPAARSWHQMLKGRVERISHVSSQNQRKGAPEAAAPLLGREPRNFPRHIVFLPKMVCHMIGTEEPRATTAAAFDKHLARIVLNDSSSLC